MLAGIEVLDTAARQKVLEVIDIDGTAVAVTTFVPSFQDFPSWLAANAMKGFVAPAAPPSAAPAPAAPAPAPAAAVRPAPAAAQAGSSGPDPVKPAPGEFTRIFQGLGSAPPESARPAASVPPTASAVIETPPAASPTPAPSPVARAATATNAPKPRPDELKDAATLIIPAIERPRPQAESAPAAPRVAAPPATPERDAPKAKSQTAGEFTRMFSVLGEEPKEEAAAHRGFTAVFGKTATPSTSPTPTTTPSVPSQPSTPVIPLPVPQPSAPVPPPPPLAAAPTGASSPGGPPLPSFGDLMAPPPAMNTQPPLSAPRTPAPASPSPTAPVAAPLPNAAPPAAAPGEFTQLFQKMTPPAGAAPGSNAPPAFGAAPQPLSAPGAPSFGGSSLPPATPLAPPPYSFGAAAQQTPPLMPDIARAFELTPRQTLRRSRRRTRSLPGRRLTCRVSRPRRCRRLIANGSARMGRRGRLAECRRTCCWSERVHAHSRTRRARRSFTGEHVGTWRADAPRSHRAAEGAGSAGNAIDAGTTGDSGSTASGRRQAKGCVPGRAHCRVRRLAGGDRRYDRVLRPLASRRAAALPVEKSGTLATLTWEARSRARARGS